MSVQEVRSAASLDIAPIVQGSKHFKELDSLRGIAALVVVVYHWTHLWPDEAYPRWFHLLLILTPLQLITNGHASVVLFFVLSGFVLSLPQVRGQEVVYSIYLVKRICRIYLPYLAALALAVGGCWYFHGLHAYDDWFERTWHNAPDWKMLVQHFFLIGDYPSDVYNTAFWSLVQEMRVSIFFPVICLVVLRLRSVGGAVLTIVLFAGGGLIARRGTLPTTDLRTIACVGTFIVGILLALYLEKLREWLSSMTAGAYWGSFALCLALYTYTPLVAYHLHSPMIASDGVIAVGGAGVVLFALADRRLSRMILVPAISFLGRVSYSLYLIHGTVLFSCAYLFHARLSPFIWFAPYLAVSLAASAVMYRWIEVPSMNLGKRLASRMRVGREPRGKDAPHGSPGQFV
jgi:peptidoglycan/LPS O-acetylase OafA/YrhL